MNISSDEKKVDTKIWTDRKLLIDIQKRFLD